MTEGEERFERWSWGWQAPLHGLHAAGIAAGGDDAEVGALAPTPAGFPVAAISSARWTFEVRATRDDKCSANCANERKILRNQLVLSDKC